MTKAKDAGKAAVVVSMSDAARDLARQRRMRPDPPPSEKRGENKDIGAGQWTPNRLGLPSEEPCPVEPLGIEGRYFHLMDSARQFVTLTVSDFTHAGVQSLFALTPNYPEWAWPRFSRGKEGEPPTIESFKDDQVRKALFYACNKKGLFSPDERLRGRGAWTLRGGQIVYHAGEDLWVCEAGRFKCVDTGMMDGQLYPRMPALPAPWTEPVTPADNPARSLLLGFRQWSWKRPMIDPVLLLGWIGVAYLGAALDWRSAVMLVGDAGTGKSTLQRALQAIFGEALFHSGDTTAAGIYQRMRQDARPVAVDELEADADMRKVQAVVKLMRIAASGEDASRGGSDHHGVTFTLRSAFLFSAINNPVQSPQDLSRVAVLRLDPLDPTKVEMPPVNAETTGRMVLGRLMAEWPRFNATRDAYMSALATGGHNARGQKTYGTLLAAADILLGPELAEELGVPLTEDLDYWARELAAEAMPEVEDRQQNWRACLTHLLTAQVAVWRNGARQSVGQCLADVVDRETDYLPAQAKRDLALTGLGLLMPGEKLGRDDGYVLAVPNNHPMVKLLFDGSSWAGVTGAPGPWRDALRQAPPDVVVTDKGLNRVWIGGVETRCSLVVLDKFHGRKG